MLRSRAEWIALAGALLGNLIVLVYCGAYISVAKGWQASHTAYTLGRDAKWEQLYREFEQHLKRQDEDRDEVRKQVLQAQQNQSELNRNQAEILKNQRDILEAMKGRTVP